MTEEMYNEIRNKIYNLIERLFWNGDMDDPLYNIIADKIEIRVNFAGETAGIDRDGFEVELINTNHIDIVGSGEFRAYVNIGISGYATAIEIIDNDDRRTYRDGDSTSFTGTINDCELFGRVRIYEDGAELDFLNIVPFHGDIDIKTPPFYPPENEYYEDDEDYDD